MISSLTLPAPSARLLGPADDGYDALRTPWNLAVDQRPAAVALPADAQQVAQIVRAAAVSGHRVAVQGGAHNPAPLGDLADTVLIRTTAMAAVTIDPARRIARVEAGALWDATVAAAAEHDLYPLHGSSPDVGVVGYSLGGGLGWVARQHGLQVNQIVAAEVVTAGGELVRVGDDLDPNRFWGTPVSVGDDADADLFWALRGGGGGFGIVTALEFRLLPISTAYAGWLAWDWSHSERVLRRFAEWAPDAPESVTASARILKVPPLPDLPDAIRGRNLVVIDGAVLGDRAAAASALAPLGELVPEIDTFTKLPASALARLHGDPEQPVPAVSDHAMLGPLDDAAIAAFVGAAGPDSGSSLLAAELRQLGGAVGRPVAEGGALSALDGDFLLFGGALAVDAEAEAQGLADAHRLTAALKPWAGGRRYGNFTETAVDAAELHDPVTYARLQEIRATVDPGGLFHGVHAIALPKAGR
jgi:FAD/FMN-containing dehydrogenase